MANTTQHGYDTSIRTKERSVVAATKLWAIVLAIVGLIGIVLLTMMLLRPFGGSTGPISSDNTATRPAEP